MSTAASSSAGKLFIVSTPIGNLQDITLRAIEVLQKVDGIACEDTRVSVRLLQHLNIHKPLLSCHEHNEVGRAQQLIQKISSGESWALISDAGTPLISDPGYRLVQQALAANIDLVAIPGPSALLGALVVSGLPTDAFYFAGFLPPKKSARQKKMTALKDLPVTLIFYESTHRIQKFLDDAYAVFGPRQAVIVREMTKKFEELLRGPLGQSWVPRSWKGEFVVLISGDFALA